MADITGGTGGFYLPREVVVLVPGAFLALGWFARSWLGLEKHFVRSDDYVRSEESRDQKCGERCVNCDKKFLEIKQSLIPREELLQKFVAVDEKLEERRKKQHLLRDTLRGLLQRQHLIHVMVVAIASKVGADKETEEAVHKARQMMGEMKELPDLDLDW